MACNVLLRFGKSQLKIQNGMVYCLRMCYQDGNISSSSGQASNQSDGAIYGAPEYYEYNEYSFNDIHAEMAKYRLPRPSSKSDNEGKK